MAAPDFERRFAAPSDEPFVRLGPGNDTAQWGIGQRDEAGKRAVPVRRSHDDHARECVERECADGTALLVGPAEHDRRAVGVVAPGAHAEGHLLGERFAARGRASLVGPDDDGGPPCA